MSKVSRKLDKWIANADDADELAEELFDFAQDADDDELDELAHAIAKRLLPQDGEAEDDDSSMEFDE